MKRDEQAIQRVLARRAVTSDEELALELFRSQLRCEAHLARLVEIAEAGDGESGPSAAKGGRSRSTARKSTTKKSSARKSPKKSGGRKASASTST